MSRRLVASIAAVTALAAVPVTVTSVAGSSAATPRAHSITVQRAGTGRLAPGGATAGELRASVAADAAGSVKAVANRSPRSHAKVLRTTPTLSGITATQLLTPQVAAAGFEGINHFDQRYLADSGNQWSLVPPDQALCASGSFVIEGVNNAIAVYDPTSHKQLGGFTSVNQLYWGDHELNRDPTSPDYGKASPHQMGDPSCVYDAGSGRFFMTVYDLTSDTTGSPLGPSSVDIAVSNTSDPADGWSIYVLDTTDPNGYGCPCFGDYPHLGTDANGLYITTNEYSTLGTASNGAMVYAIDKTALVNGTASVPGASFSTKSTDPNQGTTYDGFTLAPAVSSGADYADNTMYFLSSDAWSGDNPITSKQVLVWRIADTSALTDSQAISSLHLEKAIVPVDAYFPPPASDQKVGSVPLADCLNLTACARSLNGKPDKYKEYEFSFDSSDSRMLQSAYADHLLWGALDTAVDVDGVTKAGVAYYVINPATVTFGDPHNTSLTMSDPSVVVKQGTLAVAGNNISYPAIGVTSAGKAVMALSLVGPDYFPSAAYLTLDATSAPTSELTVVGAGQGPDDDFSGYKYWQYNRPRWGDYGAAAVVGSKVWIASEYIAQTCSLSDFRASNFTCGNTRTALANWSTHVAVVDTSVTNGS